MSISTAPIEIEVLRSGAASKDTLTGASTSKISAFERDHPSDGQIRLCMDRRAAFFQSFPVSDRAIEVILARANEDIAGLAVLNRVPILASKSCKNSSIAYVSSLRILSQFQRGAAFRRGLSALADLLEANPADYLLGFVMEDNTAAQSLLLGRNRKVLQTVDLGRYCTYILRPSRRAGKNSGKNTPVQIRRAKPSDIPMLLQFLKNIGARKSFFPEINQADLLKSEMFRGLRIENFLLALSNEQLIGSLALWSQQSYRRWLVQGYARLPEPLRNLHNLWAKACGRLQLPAPGSGFQHCFATLFLRCTGV